MLGSHSYTDSANYPVNVTIVKNSETATAWSLAQVSKINKPPFLPPFPLARLIPTFNFSEFTVTSGSSKFLALSGTMSVENKGNKTSTPSALRFYLASLSNNQFTNASQIYYLNQESYALPAIKAGMKFNIPLTYSLNANGSIGKNTLLVLPTDLVAYPNAFPKATTVIVYAIDGSDPIADQQAIPVYYYNFLNYTP